MGTNYYARIIPSHERKKELHDAIEANDFHLIEQLTGELYGRIQLSYDTNELIGGEAHLGKRSGGWKFLWNPNVYVLRHGHIEDINGVRTYISDPDTAIYLYPLNKKGLRSFIDREDIEIYDEYGDKQDKEEFWKEALECTTWKGEEAWDSDSYEEWEKSKNTSYHSYTYTGELVDLLKKEGYEMNTPNNYDFYSDGLRFATYTDFS